VRCGGGIGLKGAMATCHGQWSGTNRPGEGGRETDSPSSSSKTAQDARQFFIWRFGGPAKDHIAQLELEMCVKTAQDDRHFCSGVVCGCFDDRIALRAPKVHYCCHYYLYETVSFSVKSHLFANTKLCTIVVFVFCGSADDRMTIRARRVPNNSTGLSPIWLFGVFAVPPTTDGDSSPTCVQKQHRTLAHLLFGPFALAVFLEVRLSFRTRQSHVWVASPLHGARIRRSTNKKKTPGEAEQMCHNRVLQVLLRWRMRGGNRASGSDFDRTGIGQTPTSAIRPAEGRPDCRYKCFSASSPALPIQVRFR